MTTEEHIERLKNSTFLMVCSGETYYTEQVKGCDLVDRMMTALYGDYNPEAPWPLADSTEIEELLKNPDNWCFDQDQGPVKYKQEVGETDYIQLFLLTHL